MGLLLSRTWWLGLTKSGSNASKYPALTQKKTEMSQINSTLKSESTVFSYSPCFWFVRSIRARDNLVCLGASGDSERDHSRILSDWLEGDVLGRVWPLQPHEPARSSFRTRSSTLDVLQLSILKRVDSIRKFSYLQVLSMFDTCATHYRQWLILFFLYDTSNRLN